MARLACIMMDLIKMCLGQLFTFTSIYQSNQQTRFHAKFRIFAQDPSSQRANLKILIVNQIYTKDNELQVSVMQCKQTPLFKKNKTLQALILLIGTWNILLTLLTE